MSERPQVSDPARTAVVCPAWHERAVREVWPGCSVIRPLQGIASPRFDRIIMLWRPDTKIAAEAQWLEVVTMRLPRDASLTWLV